MPAPNAKKNPHSLTHHNHTRIDQYYWMRDDERTSEEIITHLNAENAYCEQVLKPTESLKESIFQELKSRIVKDDSSVPCKDGTYYYYSEISGDDEYPRFYRALDTNKSGAQLLLDVNALASKHEYFELGGLVVSQCETRLAFSQDTLGRRIYEVYFYDLNSGQLLVDVLNNTEGQMVWANDNQHVYYVKKDEQTLLGFQVFRHKLGTPQSQDVCVFENSDDQFYLSLGKSRDDAYILIDLEATTSTQSYAIAADIAPDATTSGCPSVFAMAPHTPDHEYDLDVYRDKTVILSNHQGNNFGLYIQNVAKTSTVADWHCVLPPCQDSLLEGVEVFADYLVVSKRQQGQISIWIYPWQPQDDLIELGQGRQVAFKDACYDLGIAHNPEPNASSVRVVYSSLTTPASVVSVCLKTLAQTQLKQQSVPNYDASLYHAERIHIPSHDGALVPVSLVYRKDTFKASQNPLYIYGYGAYGITIDPSFSRNTISLLDRGFVYAIAHVRGSEFLGRTWYEQGRMQHKQNTFSDFIAVTKGLLAQGYGKAGHVYASGGSAGGLLMGAVVNQAPELYRAVALHVPFLDVLTTMLDESIPLTTNEYDEWGNPNDEADYQTILNYSPYDNIKAQNYPAMLVTTGFHDSQVQYWEPMKWVAKTREMKTDTTPLLFYIDMDSGHGGAQGRYKSLHDTALEISYFVGIEQGLLFSR